MAVTLGRPPDPQKHQMLRYAVVLVGEKPKATWRDLELAIQRRGLTPLSERSLRGILSQARKIQKETLRPSIHRVEWLGDIRAIDAGNPILTWNFMSELFLGHGITDEEAQWGGLVQRTASSLDPFVQWFLAKELALRPERPGESPQLVPEDLQHLLAVRPWESDSQERLWWEFTRTEKRRELWPEALALSVPPFVCHEYLMRLIVTSLATPTWRLADELGESAMDWTDLCRWAISGESDPDLLSGWEGELPPALRTQGNANETEAMER